MRVIVKKSSMSGLLGEPGSYAYVASKHGIMGLTKTAAYEFADKGNPHQCGMPCCG
jgi:NAD(P)-dependent dehydrogenase (short-subunit alcohol dehydrogenase family)